MSDPSLVKSLLASPTEFHFIGSTSKVMLKFNKDPETGEFAQSDEEREIAYEETVSKWQANGGSTHLWEYIWDVLKDAELKADSDVYIITDGEDNQSTGEFNGLHGYIALIDSLKIRFEDKIEGGLPRLNIFWIGAMDTSTADLRKNLRTLAINSGGELYADGAQFVGSQTKSLSDRATFSTNQKASYNSYVASGAIYDVNALRG